MKSKFFTDERRSFCDFRFSIFDFRLQIRKSKFEIRNLSMFICVHLWTIFLALQLSAQTYKNPVIPGDFPDPSVIRIGNDYFATATTGGWSPHFPLLHSKDLVNWKTIGAVFYNKPAWAKGDFWAPEIVEDNGSFFVYYTARRDEGTGKKGTLCIAVAVAEKPQGPYIDKGSLVCQEMGSIDADFVRDENNKPFLIWKEDGNDRRQPTWLYAQELDESGTKVLGNPTKLFRNTEPWEGGVVEGAFLVRRDGWFYLFYSGNACCGRECNYALGVARSKTLLGNWEKNPANPILAENEIWQCPGHGSIVETPDDRSFLLYHAYKKNNFALGREALLDEVKYENGWATINDGKGASDSANSPFKNTIQQSIFTNLSDEFNGEKLEPFWSRRIFNSESASLKKGFLTLAPDKNQIIKEKMPEIVISERSVSGDYTATTRVDFEKIRQDESGGISVYGWRDNAVGLSIGNGKIFSWRREDDKQENFGNLDLPKNKKEIWLRVKVSNGETFDFSMSSDGKNWQSVGEKITFEKLEGARLSLIYNGKTTNAGVRFDWIRVTGN